MALDIEKLRRRLPSPPAEGNPEMEAAQIPAAPTDPAPRPASAPAPSRTAAMPRKPSGKGRGPEEVEAVIMDGRSLRRTGRTEQLNLKVKPETKAAFLRIAAARGMTMVEVLEELLEKG